jgi:hypothetical protein
MLAAEAISSVMEVLGATLPFATCMLSVRPDHRCLVGPVVTLRQGRGLAYDLGRFVGVALVATTASLLTEVLGRRGSLLMSGASSSLCLGRGFRRTCLECSDCVLHGRVDMGVVEVGQRAVILEGGQQPGIGFG